MKSIRLIKFDYYKGVDGDLVTVEGRSDNVPFSIARIFNVRADKGCTRGRHAHRECTQLLICTNGTVKVTCDDGKQTSTYILDEANHGLLIEPGIWAEQKYVKKNTVLTVLCDLEYDENDYIRDYEVFLKYKGVR
jgi:dTDP-4-dehydrorhamnose 3,5-epimerase-like enzyme